MGGPDNLLSAIAERQEAFRSLKPVAGRLGLVPGLLWLRHHGQQVVRTAPSDLSRDSVPISLGLCTMRAKTTVGCDGLMPSGSELVCDTDFQPWPRQGSLEFPPDPCLVSS